MRKILLAMLAAGALAAAEAPPPKPALLSEGRWEFEQEGKPAGSESFRAERLPGGGLRHRSELHLANGGQEASAASTLTLDPSGWPLDYGVDLRGGGGPDQYLACRVEDTEVYMLIDFGEGAEPAEQVLRYERRPRLLDHNSYSQYRYLVDWPVLERIGRLEFEVLVPQSYMHTAITAEYRGVTSLPWKDGHPRRLHTAYLFIANTMGVFVYYDGAYEPVRVEIPSQQASGTRVDHEPLEVKAPAGNAAVEPAPSGPWRDEFLRFQSGGLTLAGTLTMPIETGDGDEKHSRKAPQERFPAVLLLSDAGGQDRDGNTPGAPGQPFFLRYLAQRLAAAGYAVFRYDERGLGGSQGDLMEAGLGDLAADARAALMLLRKRPDVDPERIVLAGQGEGGLLALMLASEDPGAAWRLVLMNTPSASLRQVMTEQLDLLPEGDARELTRQAQEEIFKLVDGGADRGDFHGKPLNLKWYREHFALDPQALARETRVPALILHGGLDRQVKPEHALYLRAALDEALAMTTLRVLPELDHLLLPSKGGSLHEYAEAGRSYGGEPAASITAWLPKP